MSQWTPERVAEVERLAAQGLSATMIAIALPFEASRNSVIGIAFRHKIRLRGHAHAQAPKSEASQRAARERGNNLAARIHQKALIQAQIRRKALKAEGQPAKGAKLTCLELRSFMCRWPIGDPHQPGFTFCGEWADEGPYCSVHRARAYQPAKASEKQMARAVRRHI